MQSLAQQGFPKSQLSQAQKRTFDDIVIEEGKYGNVAHASRADLLSCASLLYGILRTKPAQ
jgi:hypothetical protein